MSRLKRHFGIPPGTISAPPPPNEGTTCREPEALIDKRMIKKHNQVAVEWLIQWKNQPAEEATWEVAEKIMELFPTFNPWGQGLNEDGGTDTNQRSLEPKCRNGPLAE